MADVEVLMGLGGRVLGTTAIGVSTLHVFLKYTLVGKAMRACSSNASRSPSASPAWARIASRMVV